MGNYVSKLVDPVGFMWSITHGTSISPDLRTARLKTEYRTHTQHPTPSLCRHGCCLDRQDDTVLPSAANCVSDASALGGMRTSQLSTPRAWSSEQYIKVTGHGGEAGGRVACQSVCRIEDDYEYKIRIAMIYNMVRRRCLPLSYREFASRRWIHRVQIGTEHRWWP